MAKTSSVERNQKRERMAKRDAPKRAELKAVLRNKEASPEERFAAMLRLAETRAIIGANKSTISPDVSRLSVTFDPAPSGSMR